MSNKIVLRQKPRVNYYEPEEPGLDEYIFCDSCGDFVYEYCSIHGPLLIVPDDKVNRNGMPAIVPRAALTIPKVFLHLAPSIIPGAGLGVFATLTLPRGVRFGPYRGKRTTVADSNYCWQIYSKEHKPTHVVDAADSSSSNWMRYVNCARHWREQNLLAYQYRGDLYYRTIKIIPRFTELMVYYGSIFARELQIDIARYNSPAGYAQKFGAPPVKKRKTNEIKPRLQSPGTSKQNAVNSETTNNISLNTQPESSSISQPESESVKTKIKPSFGKNARNKKEHIKLDKSLKKNVIQNNNKNETKNTVKNTAKQLSLESAVPKKKVKNEIAPTPITTSTSSIIRTNNTCVDLKKCEVCNFKYINKEDLSEHMGFHDNNRPHLCDMCDYRFDSLDSLKRHKAIVHNIDTTEKYICDRSNFECTIKNSLVSNTRTHTGEKPYSCDICSYKCITKYRLTTHMTTHTGEKPYSCDICSYKCIPKGDLAKHMRTHTGEKPYSCNICSYKCITKGHLTTHMRTHTGEKPYSCNICSYKCITKGYLTTHMRTHTGEKPYSCNICSYKCITKGHLTTHMRTHTGEKPYSCNICSYKCITKGYLTTHMRTHTGEKPYSCNICSYKCITKGHLTTHMRTHTGEKPYSCNICSYKCAHNNNLKHHLTTKHLYQKK